MRNLESKIYQKEDNLNIKQLFREMLRDIFNSRFLARQLAERDIKAQYRQSYLGLAWIFINPLLTAAVWVFLNVSGTVKITDTGIPYPIFAFSGTLLWSIVTEAILTPMQSTNSARGLLSKINFPKEALILSGIYKLLFNSSLKVVLLISFIFIFGMSLKWSLLLLPFLLLGALLFGTMIGLFVTPIGMLYKDVSKIISFGINFLMYVTPVVYALPDKGILRDFMEINPITPIILTGRDMLTGTDPAYLEYFLILMLASIPLFLVALLIYRISIPIVVERIS